MSQMVIQVYLCPTEGCTSYYGAPGMPDLATAMTGVKTEDRAAFHSKHGTYDRHTRAACPNCRAQGQDVQRVLTEITVTRPAPVTPAKPYTMA